MLIKSLFDHRLNKNKPQDFPILADLPEKIKEMIPGFNKLVVISRESVIRLKFHMGDLIILLKNGRKFKVLLFPSNIRKVRSYLKFTNWI